jgi:hypothetical protein
MTTTHFWRGRHTTRYLARIATSVIAGVAYFSLMIVALHALRPDLNAISQPTSQYAVGPFGWLMTSAFFGMSLASFALVLGLSLGVPEAVRSRLGLGLLSLWAVGVLIAMIFPLNPIGTPATLSSTVHRIAGPPTFLCLTVGMILVSSRFQRDEKWAPIYRTALTLSLITLVAFITTFVTFATGSALFGLVQRITLATAVTWMLLTATHLRTVAPKYIAR